MKHESLESQIEQEFLASESLKVCEECRKELGYDHWAIKVIECICNEKRINSVVKIEEIKCVIREDGHYPESYNDGDSPQDTWQAEIQAIEDSQ